MESAISLDMLAVEYSRVVVPKNIIKFTYTHCFVRFSFVIRNTFTITVCQKHSLRPRANVHTSAFKSLYGG